jgi:hypothetical protein
MNATVFLQRVEFLALVVAVSGSGFLIAVLVLKLRDVTASFLQAHRASSRLAGLLVRLVPMPSYRRPLPTPSRTNADYTAEERAEFRRRFIPVANAEARRGQFAGAALVTIALLGFLQAMAPTSWPASFFWISTSLVIGAALVISLLSQHAFNCPACSNSLNGLGRFCPACGAFGLERAQWFSIPVCKACGRTLGARRSRYPIRACTHCGLLLGYRQ